MPLRGKPRLVWKHNKVDLGSITAAPGGQSLALTVFTRPRSARAPSFYLYLLQPDGKVQPVDAVNNYGSIDSPVFLRSPGQPHGPVRLYWIRSHEELEPGTDRLQKQVMVLDGGTARAVRVPLRWNEAVDSISAYAGSETFAISLYRNDNLPTRLEVLRSAAIPSLTFWAEFGAVANTDVFTGVAWLSPREYVVPVGHRAYRGRFSLRLFRVGCEYSGSHVVYQGNAVDWGFQETPWPLLPGPANNVLVLGSRDLAKVAAAMPSPGSASHGRRPSKTAPWMMVNVHQGTMTRTDARWSPQGWWTFIQKPSSQGPPTSSKDAACSKYSWTYP